SVQSGPALCEGRAGIERHERPRPAFHADSPSAPRPAGRSGFAAAARTDRVWLSAGESARRSPAATGCTLAAGAADRNAVHTHLVRRAAAGPEAPGTDTADHNRSVWLPGGTVAAPHRLGMAGAPLQPGLLVAGADHLCVAAAGRVADCGQQSRGEGGARVVGDLERRVGYPADARGRAGAARIVSTGQGLKIAPDARSH